MNDSPAHDSPFRDQSRPDPEWDPRLDSLIAAIRAEDPPAEWAGPATARVWAALQSAATDPAGSSLAVASCDDYQALIPAFLSGTLPAGRALLLEDHTRECPACRKALWRARSQAAAPGETAQSAILETAQSGTAVATNGSGRTAVGGTAVATNGSGRTAVGDPAVGGLAVGGLAVVGSSVHAARTLPARPRARTWALAAAVVAAVGLVAALAVSAGLVPGLAPSVARAAEVEGTLYRVADADGRPMAAGTRLNAGEAVRTARGARAVLRLADGSEVEMRERTELAVMPGWQSTTVRVGRGDIIVHAAPQGAGHLYVVTDDCRVAVKGTIFAVTHGTKGSRVSVLQGKVHVTQGHSESELSPGQQVSTQPGVEAVPLEDEVSWSRDKDDYLHLVSDLKALQQDLAKLPRPGQRHTAALLDRVPPGTVIYVAMPNLSGTLADSHKLIQQHLSDNPLVADWWQGAPRAKMEDDMAKLVTRVATVGRYLGDEIVIAVGLDAHGEPAQPVVLAQVTDEAALRTALAAEVERVNTEAQDHVLRMYEEAAGPEVGQGAGSDGSKGAGSGGSKGAGSDGGQGAGSYAGQDVVLLAVRDGLFVASPDRDALAGALAGRPATEPFSQSRFGRQIAGDYGQGVDWLFAVDVARVIGAELASTGAAAESNNAADVDFFRHLGLLDVQSLLVRVASEGGQAHHQADVIFAGPRHGMAAWLAEPAPMSALDYVSPDATLLAAFVIQNPSSVVTEWRDMMGELVSGNAADAAELNKAFDDVGAADFAAAMGGEMALAIDGPLLPQPGWKLVLEVYDPAKFQQAMVRLVARLNEAAGEGSKSDNNATDAGSKLEEGFRLEEGQLQGRPVYILHTPIGSAAEVAYLYRDGYLIAAPSRALLDAALRSHDAGSTLASAPQFRALLPADGELNFSAIVYQNWAAAKAMLAPAAKQLMDAHKARPGEQPGGAQPNAQPDAQAARSLAGLPAELGAAWLDAAGPEPASLDYAYAQADRIQIAGQHRSDRLGFGLWPILGLPQANPWAQLDQVMEGAAVDTATTGDDGSGAASDTASTGGNGSGAAAVTATTGGDGNGAGGSR